MGWVFKGQNVEKRAMKTALNTFYGVSQTNAKRRYLIAY